MKMETTPHGKPPVKSLPVKKSAAIAVKGGRTQERLQKQAP